MTSSNSVSAILAKERVLKRLKRKPGTSAHVVRVRYANSFSWLIEFSYVREASLRILLRYQLLYQGGQYELLKLDTWEYKYAGKSFTRACQRF